VGYFGSLDACCHEEVDRDRLQGRDVRRVACQRRPRLVGVYRGVLTLRAPTMHLQLHPLRKLAGQVLDVDPRATVYVRWVLAGQQRDAHRSRPDAGRDAGALGDHDNAAGRDREAFAVGSEVDADLRAGLDDDVLVEDRVADHPIAAHVHAREQDG
jgi:hypothetical protein